MKIFNAADFGIVPNEDISEKLAEFISALKAEDGGKTAVFDSGTYYIDSERCKEYMLVITNTAGEKEFSPDETPHLNAVPFYFGGISNLVFDGGDSVFVIDGKVTNIAVEDCRNITLRNLEIRHAHPDMHEFSVVRKSANSSSARSFGGILRRWISRSHISGGSGVRCLRYSSPALSRTSRSAIITPSAAMRCSL